MFIRATLWASGQPCLLSIGDIISASTDTEGETIVVMRSSSMPEIHVRESAIDLAQLMGLTQHAQPADAPASAVADVLRLVETLADACKDWKNDAWSEIDGALGLEDADYEDTERALRALAKRLRGST